MPIAKKPLPKVDKKTKVWVRIRTYEGSLCCDMWVLCRDGNSTSCALHGLVPIKKAEEVAKAMGLPTERESRHE